MDEIYDYRQYPYNIYINISNTKVYLSSDISMNRNDSSKVTKDTLSKDACIIYNKKKEILSWGDSKFETDNENHISIDNFKDRLYLAFQQLNKERNDETSFFLCALSDYLRLAVKELEIEITKEYDYMHCDGFQYIFVVASEWEENMRTLLIRPALISAGLISENDNPNRVLYVTDVESIVYLLQHTKFFEYQYFFKRGQNTIICRFVPTDSNTTLIKLDLISTINQLFDIEESIFFPKVVNSNSITMTSNDIKESIQKFLKAKLLPLGKDYDMDLMTKDIYTSKLFDMNSNDKNDGLIITWIEERSEWGLNALQKEIISSIHYSEIFDEIGKSLYSKMSDIISNKLVAKYMTFMIEDRYSTEIEIDPYLKNWLTYTLEYNIVSLNNISTIYEAYSGCAPIGTDEIFFGASKAILEVHQNADVYCKPRILPIEDVATSSSIFLNSKPNAIINIDISFNSTLISYSVLSDKGLIEDIFEITEDSSLPSLGEFYDISNTITLNAKHSFISFSETHLTKNSFIKRFFFSTKKKKNLISKIEAILLSKQFSSIQKPTQTGKRPLIKTYLQTYLKESIIDKDYSSDQVFISITQKKYIKAFILMYIKYIKKVISKRVSTHLKHGRKDVKIGYAVSIEKKLLDNVIGTKKDLKELIYASELLHRDDGSKKLRIVTHGEGCLPLIRKYSKLTFPLKTYFILAQLREDYIQLTLNQVVTESNLEEEQEEIIIRDKIFSIPNIYDSMCLFMWNNLIKDHSLIESCCIHNKNNKNEIIELFSLKNKNEFTNNLKQFISNNIFNENVFIQRTSINKVQLSISCSCRVNLTVDDIIGISFRPLIQDMASMISTSLTSKQIFGCYSDLQYVFAMVHFNNSVLFQDMLAKILKEEIEDANREKERDASFFFIPELPGYFLKPVLNQIPVFYKPFMVGTLHQVYSENFGFRTNLEGYKILFSDKKNNVNSVELKDGQFIFLAKKGDIMSDVPLKMQLYLNFEPVLDRNEITIEYCAVKHFDELDHGPVINFTKESCKIIGSKEWNLHLNGSELVTDIPVVISMDLKNYSSLIWFSERITGEIFVEANASQLGEPLTLSRF